MNGIWYGRTAGSAVDFGKLQNTFAKLKVQPQAKSLMNKE
jgi:hypothetical protein